MLTAALAAAAAGCERGRMQPPSGPTPAPRVDSRTAAPSAGAFTRVFTDITPASGVRFRHITGGYGDKLLPETLGAGGAFLDYDGDGRLDIFLVNSCYWPEHAPADQPAPACALYRGRGDGTFEDATDAAGAGISLYGMGCAIGDYDGDGDEDIYVTAVGGNVLLRNDGGRFRGATEEAGVAGGRWSDGEGHLHPEWSTAAAWADFDLDGDLDLFVGNYVQWSPATEIFTTFDGTTKAFTTPDRYPGLPCRYFRNRGDGTFEDASSAAGLTGLNGKTLGLALWDFEGDGLLDIVVANDTRQNFLFLGRGKGRFQEDGLRFSIAYDEAGRARAGMGIDIADYSNDGVPGVAIGNFSAEPISLYRWNPPAGFSSVAPRAGLAEATYHALTFGLLFLDLDLDGLQDLVVVNGHIEPEIARFLAGESYAQPAQLFRGLGGGAFQDVSTAAGADFTAPRVGRGLAAGDIDSDGDLDLLITTNSGPPVILRNDLREGAEPHHFLRVRLRGRGMNRRGIGASVRLVSGGVVQRRIARTGSSYLSQCESTLTFGLGDCAAVERLTVRWPSGRERDYPVAAVDRTIEISED